MPLVMGIPLPHQLEILKKPLIVSLHATPERLIQVRQNRLLGIGASGDDTYIDRQTVAEEVAFSRKLAAKFHWAILDVTRRSIEETAAAVMKLLADRQRHKMAGNDNLFLWFTSNHDENTWNGTEYEKYGDAAEALAVFSFTWNGIPLIYSGQELPNLKRLGFFDKDVIEWNGSYAKNDFYKTLLHLHKNHPALRAGERTVSTHVIHTNADDVLMAYLRKNEDKEVFTILNLSKYNIDCVIEDNRLTGLFKNVFTGEEIEVHYESRFALQPWAYLVFEK